jgi:hypothetical protein
MQGDGMSPNRHRPSMPGRRWWRASRPLLVIIAIAVLVGVIVGIAAGRVASRRPVAAPSPPAAPTQPSRPAPSTSIIPTTISRDPPTSTSTTVSSSTRSSTTLATRKAPAKLDTPILQQRQSVPDGVLAQMESSIGGAGGEFFCAPEFGMDVFGRPREPTIAIGTAQRPNFAVLEVAAPIQLCLWRFEAGHSIQVNVRYPNGRVVKLIGYSPESPCHDDICYSHVNWAAVSGDPFGDYEITAIQGQLRAVGTVRVVPATDRRILVVGNGIDEGQYQTFKRGQMIRVAAAGYQPHGSVQLLIYYTTERELQRSMGELRFRTWVQLRTDPQGGAVYNLRTTAGDPPGCYALDTHPAPQFTGRFEDPGDGLVYLKDTEPLFCLT